MTDTIPACSGTGDNVCVISKNDNNDNQEIVLIQGTAFFIENCTGNDNSSSKMHCMLLLSLSLFCIVVLSLVGLWFFRLIFVGETTIPRLYQVNLRRIITIKPSRLISGYCLIITILLMTVFLINHHKWNNNNNNEKNAIFDNLKLLVSSMEKMTTWYMQQLDDYPLLTKSITAGILSIVGDLLAQYTEFKSQMQRQNDSNNNKQDTIIMSHNSPHCHYYHYYFHYDYRRGMSLLVDGMFVSAPVMHVAFDIMEQWIPINNNNEQESNNHQAMIAAILHVILNDYGLDCLFVALMFINTGILEGYTVSQLITQFQMDYIPAVKASWITNISCFPIEFILFRYFPLQYRVLCMNLIDIVWNAVISFNAHKHRRKKEGL